MTNVDNGKAVKQKVVFDTVSLMSGSRAGSNKSTFQSVLNEKKVPFCSPYFSAQEAVFPDVLAVCRDVTDRTSLRARIDRVLFL